LLMQSPPSNPIFGFKRRCSASGGTFREQVPPEPPSKLFLQNSLRNSDLDCWGYGWEYVYQCLELILFIFRDREVGVWGRRNFASPSLRKREEGVPGERFFSPPVLSAPYEVAYVSPLTEYSGEGSGRPSNWGRGQSPLPRFGGGEIPLSPKLLSPCITA